MKQKQLRSRFPKSIPAISLQKGSTDDVFEHLEGIIGMIDHIQDYLTDHGYFKEKTVFPVKEI